MPRQGQTAVILFFKGCPKTSGGRNTASIKISDLCEGCISLSVAEGSGDCSFAFVIRAVEGLYLVALLTFSDALSALFVVLDSASFIQKERHFLFVLFTHSSHR